ncbi:MAG: hypothetical protein M1835_006133 [Candelina submexicana]|nr:MAG: hypothetical protein M1835_006133 [Candelina submexicana]
MKSPSKPRSTRPSSRRDKPTYHQSASTKQIQQQARPSATNKSSVKPSPFKSTSSREAETPSVRNPNFKGSKKRKLSDTQPRANTDAQEYPVLKARTKTVPSEVVASKWEVLSDPVQTRLLDLFKAVQRPVLSSHRDPKRRNEAQSALAPVVRTLARRLPRMPFPSTTKDWHFDYEKLLDSNRTLESLLTPTIHSIELLKAEIDKEERALNGDRKQLDELEQNAAFAEKERTRQTKKAHALLRLQDLPAANADETNVTGIPIKAPSGTLTLESELDPNLWPLAEQLQNHLGSMQSNTAQIFNVMAALVRTRAAVDDACYKHLAPTEYEQIHAR